MENFIVDAKQVLLLVQRNAQAPVIEHFIEQGIIVGKLAYRPGSCEGCIFEKWIGCPRWFACDAREILIWNHLSKYYVEESAE